MLAASTDDVRASMDFKPLAIISSNSPNSAASFAKLAAMDGSTLFGDAEGLGPARMLPTLIGETDDARVELDDAEVEPDDAGVELEDAGVELEDAGVGLDRVKERLDRVWVRLEGELVGRVRLLVELDRTVLELDDALVEPVVLLMELDRTLLELELDGALVELTLLLVELALLALLEYDCAATAGRTTRKRRQTSVMECILRFDVNEITRSFVQTDGRESLKYML